MSGYHLDPKYAPHQVFSMNPFAPSNMVLQLTSHETESYELMYNQLDPTHKGIDSTQMISYLQTSSLDRPLLQQIWQCAELSKPLLTKSDFVLAMKYAAIAQAGLPIAKDSLTKSTPLAKFAQIQQLPVETISPDEIHRYSQFFESASPVDGYLPGIQARELLMKSNLSNEQLGQIWVLVDREGLGKLSLNPFILAMYLIMKVKAGGLIPTVYPIDVFGQIAAVKGRGSVGSTANYGPSYTPSAIQVQKTGQSANYGAAHAPSAIQVQPTGQSVNYGVAYPPSAIQVQKTGQSAVGSFPTYTAPPISSPYSQFTPQPVQPSGPSLQRGNSNLSNFSGAANLNNVSNPPTSTEGSTPIEKSQNYQYFDTLDKSKKGSLTGSEVFDFFRKSNLPPSDLSQIW
jgi:hypothetical protein